jgi:hypothetical protein
VKKQLLLLVALFTLGVSLNFIGCGSTPAPAAPAASSALCASPTNQGQTAGGAVTGAEGSLETQAVTLAAAEMATSISLYVGSGPVTGQIRFAIYGDNGSTYPANLIVETPPQNLVAASWNTASLPNVYLPAGIYHLAFNGNGYKDSYTSSGGTNCYFTYGWAVFPDTFPAAQASDAWVYSLYITTCP